MRFACVFHIYCAMFFFFSEKKIKSIGSATTAQIDKTGKETETECIIKEENERGLLALGGGRLDICPSHTCFNNTFIFIKTN